MSRKERNRMTIMAGVKGKELTQVPAAGLMGLGYRQTKRVWRRCQDAGDAEAANFQKFSGVAPVTGKSGHRKWVHWRWSAPRFLRQSLVEWTNQSIDHSTWAAAFYNLQKSRGKRHQAIIRSLAFKWNRILWKCRVDHVPYDEARYLKHLAAKNPSLLALTYGKSN